VRHVTFSGWRGITGVLHNFLSDLRYGSRLLRQSPGFTGVAVLALALGIGANTAIFSTLQALMLRALPYQDSDRLVMVWEDASFASFPKNTPAPGNYYAWREQNRVFTDMAATRGEVANLTGDGAPEQLIGRLVTANFFDVLGTQPIIGRAFTDAEDRTTPHLVILSYGLWQRRYAGDPGIVNRSILMNGIQYTVLGVMPRNFVFRNREIDYWGPINLTPKQAAEHGSHYLNVVARLKPGVTVQAARDEMKAIAKRLEAAYPADNARVGAVVVPLREELLGKTRLAVMVLMGAAGFVLLIACANLASLLLARAAARRRELAVRAALGAGRGRLIRQMVTEGLLLAVCGGLLGLGLARAGMTLLAKLAPAGFSTEGGVHLDWQLLAFALTLSLITGVLFSIVPALQASRTSLNDALRQGGRGGIGGRRAGTRDALVMVEVAAALVLLVGAGLMLRTLTKLRAIDIGFRPDRLLTLRTILPRDRYQEPSRRLAFFNRVMDGVRALPGVEGASYNSMLPFLSTGNTQAFRVEGRERPAGEPGDALLRVGDSHYLKTLGVRLVEGRFADFRDGTDAPPVLVINATLAQLYWPKESALGHRIKLISGNPEPWRTIVGVVIDVHERGYELEMKPGVYIPFAQAVDTWAQPANIVVRTKGDPLALSGAVRRIIAGVDPEQPVAAVRTMEDIMDLEVQDRTQQMALLGIFAGLALWLAAIGLYGVLSYVVTQRSAEIGLRMALGATARNVQAMVVGHGLALTAGGVLIGLALAVAGTRFMKTMLYGVDAFDPATFAGVSGLLCAIAVLACWIPARRASRLDPVVALREE
jgi:putative ABC transport system permease protein